MSRSRPIPITRTISPTAIASKTTGSMRVCTRRSGKITSEHEWRSSTTNAHTRERHATIDRDVRVPEGRLRLPHEGPTDLEVPPVGRDRPATGRSTLISGGSLAQQLEERSDG